VEKSENWKDVEGYEGLYQVSTLGRVSRQGVIRKTQANNVGYNTIDLYKNNKRKTMLIHRLMALAFLPKIPGKNNVNHKNGVRGDNTLSNLEWCTQQENIKHAFDVLGYRNNFQTNHPRPSLGKFGKDSHTSKPVRQMKGGDLITLWDSGMDAVRAGFRSSKITECCQGKRKTHGGYEWQYATATQ
jgi:hypothetical protein